MGEARASPTGRDALFGGPINAGLDFRLEAELCSIPLYIYKSIDEFRRAMEDTVRTTFLQGLHGWKVTDCTVTMTEAGYATPSTSAKDFRLLTPLVLMSALREAGTWSASRSIASRSTFRQKRSHLVVSLLGRLGAVLQSSEARGSSHALEGEIAATRMHELRQQLPAATHGEGVVESFFGGYRELRGTTPTRPRSDSNPLNRTEYLSHIARRF